MTASLPSSSVPAWRVAAIGAVGALAVGIGATVGGFLLDARATSVGSAASYVPSSAPMYFEVRLEPSEAQDASLRELLGRFPDIDGLDLERPLYEQMTDAIDDATNPAADVSWSEDIATWFDGRVGIAVLDFPAAAFNPADFTAEPAVPSMVALFGVDDPAAAEAAIGRLRDEAAMTFTEQTHAGFSIHIADDADGFAYSLTDDQLIIAPVVDDIVAALDAHASSETLSEAASITRLAGALPSDWLMFGVYDLTDMMAAAFDSAAAASPDADAFRELIENQPLRGAMAVTADGDRVTIEMATDPPTGPLAVVNADRGLADEVPGDALYYAEGGNVGAALSAMIGPMKESLAGIPGAEEQLAMIESALGGDVEELVSWMGDAATVAGWDGEQVWGGMVIVPTDADAARDTMSQLATFAGLAALDPSIGITLEERDVDGETIHTLRWHDPNAVQEPDQFTPPMSTPTEIVVEWLVGDDRVVIGIGDRFVERVHDQAAGDSLAEVARYRDAVADLGGASNAGVTWVDLRGIVAAVQAATAGSDPMMGDVSSMLEWLAPLDRLVGVNRVQGEVVLSSVVLLVE